MTSGKPSLFQRFRKGLQRTTEGFTEKVGGVFSRAKIDDDDIDLIEETLFSADFGVETTEEVVEAIRKGYRKNKDLRGKEAAEIGSRILEEVLVGSEGTFYPHEPHPSVIALVGVNGSGKTTTSAKLAWHYKQSGHSVLVGACDTFRAAANEQLKVWSGRLGIDVVESHQGADPAAVAFDSFSAAEKRDTDLLVLDTAGRLHTKSNLMEELKKVRRVLDKKRPGSPEERWLVIDGSHGSNSVQQARIFHEAFDLTGIVITKLDGTSRGGGLVGIYRELKLPIQFVGLGEQPEDLQRFSAKDYAEAVFGVQSE
ncbi:MAG: signal recognition particle-docking protein FtsY [Verrucomicrobiota bacterium]